MDLGIDGHAAIVAASSSGLGQASAKALAEEGADVIINGRYQDSLETTAAELRETAEGAVVPHAADLTEPDAGEALVDRALDEFGRLDHLVTSAGGVPSGSFLETDDADWQAAYDLLVKSVVRLCRAAADPLRADGGGTITCITSQSVKEAIDDLVLSNAVRMSVVGLEKTLAREFAPEVRANVVMPGTHATDRLEYLVERDVERGRYDTYEESRAGWMGDVPLERMGDPERFGQVVAFLCSEPANYINGEAVMVDGGDARSTL